MDEVGILHAGCGLDTARDVDAPGHHRLERFRDVVCIETAGENHAALSGDRGRNLPVDLCATTARRSLVHEDVRNVPLRRGLALAHHRPALYVLRHIEVVEIGTVRLQDVGTENLLHLAPQRDLGVAHDRYPKHMPRDPAGDERGMTRGNLSCRIRKHEAQGVRAGRNGRIDADNVGQTADLDDSFHARMESLFCVAAAARP